MIIPSIDLQGGQAVQLVGGEDLEIEAGAPMPLLQKFRLAGDVAIIDLDAAKGEGSNTALIRELLPHARCRVGGGIRSVEAALEWLDAGAHKVILGTAATPEILRQLPAERVIAALDARHGEVVVQGWREGTGRTILDRMRELEGLVGGFLVTFVEHEGRMSGTAEMEQIAALVEAAGDAKLTIAGGVTTATELAELDALGVDAQVGMALYSGQLHLADAICARMRSDRPDGLWSTVVVDEHGVALGLCYSNLESVRAAVDRVSGVYHSRRRGLWHKGASSGATQELLAIDLDCDHDALRFTVRQRDPGFCHEEVRTCWGPDSGITALARTIRARAEDAPEGSYTRRLFDDPELLGEKLLEEARELIEAKDADEAAWETADLLYFALVAMTARGASLEDVARELDRRTARVRRRAGDAKS